MDKGSYIFPAPKPHESSFWPENETNLSELDPKNLTIYASTMTTEPEKPLSEVEKANDETLLYDRLKEWKAALIEATGVYLDAENKVIDCKNKIKYYEKAIKDYEKAFKK